jgi:hypothetical protein
MDVAIVCPTLVFFQTEITAPILVCLAFLLVFLMERAIDLAVIPTQFLVSFSIFFFRCFLVRDLGFLVIEVGLLAHSFLPNSLGVLADDYDSSPNPTVVGVVCGCSAYPTLLVS